MSEVRDHAAHSSLPGEAICDWGTGWTHSEPKLPHLGSVIWSSALPSFAFLVDFYQPGQLKRHLFPARNTVIFQRAWASELDILQ